MPGSALSEWRAGLRARPRPQRRRRSVPSFIVNHSLETARANSSNSFKVRWIIDLVFVLIWTTQRQLSIVKNACGGGVAGRGGGGGRGGGVLTGGTIRCLYTRDRACVETMNSIQPSPLPPQRYEFVVRSVLN